MTSIKTNNDKLQIDKANDILMELKVNVSAQDRDEAQRELDLSAPTINRYLLGEAKNVDTAIRLIQFFRKRILDRERDLQGAA